MRKTIIQTLIISFFFISFNATAEIKHIKDGNVDAKVKLVVFESLTCSHCGDFHRDISVSYTHLTLPTNREV